MVDATIHLIRVSISEFVLILLYVLACWNQPFIVPGEFKCACSIVRRLYTNLVYLIWSLAQWHVHHIFVS